jgi:hypothetical protein
VVLWREACVLQTCTTKGSNRPREARVPDLKVTAEVGRTFNLCGVTVGESRGSRWSAVTGRIKGVFIIRCEQNDCCGNYTPRPASVSSTVTSGSWPFLHQTTAQNKALNKATECLPIAVFIQFKIRTNWGWEQAWMAGSNHVCAYFSHFCVFSDVV